MNNKEISRLLGIDATFLVNRCCINRGSFFVWILREVMFHQYYNFEPPEQDCLLHTLKHTLSLPPTYAHMGTELLVNKLMRFEYERINRSIVLHSINNPFGVKL